MFKKINELLDYIKQDVSAKGLTYVFPEVNNIFILNKNGDSEEIYTRLNRNYFNVEKVKDKVDWMPDELNNEYMLKKIQDLSDYGDLRIQKTEKGYDIIIIKVEINNTQRDKTVEVKRIDRYFSEVKQITYFYTKGKVDFQYKRINAETFEVTKTLFTQTRKYLSDKEMLNILKQSLEDYIMVMHSLPTGYYIELKEI